MKILKYQFVYFALAISAIGTLNSVAQAADAKTKEVEFKVAGQTYFGEEVLTTGSHPFNQMAKKLKAALNQLKIISSSEFLTDVGAQGAYLASQNTIFIGNYIQNEDPYSQPTFLHEVVHAYIHHQLISGKISAFRGHATNSDPSLKQLSYGPRFSIDEVNANLFSLDYSNKKMRALSEALLKKIDSKKVYQIYDGVFDTLEYAGRIKRMLTTLELALNQSSQSSKGDLLKIMKDINIKWQTLSTGTVTVVLPAELSVQRRQAMVKLSQTVFPLIQKIDLLFPELRDVNQENISGLKSKINDYIDLSEQIVQAFKSQFPEETSVWTQL